MTQQIQVRLFGAFRQYAVNDSVAVSLPENATVATLREAFAAQFDDDNACALLQASVFATDDAVLTEEAMVPANSDLCVLPPVCGG